MGDCSENECEELSSPNTKEARCPASDEMETFEKLATGLIQPYEKNYEEMSTALISLNKAQEELISLLSKKNTEITKCQADLNIMDMIGVTKHCADNLNRLKKDMFTLQEKSFRLKKRALALEAKKRAEALTIEQAKDHELERQKHLVAKVAK